METSLDCLVCFLRQARATGLLAADTPEQQRQLLVQAGGLLADFDMKRSPPENATMLYAAFAEILQNIDPFATVKKQSNAFAISLKEAMAARIQAASDPLLAALRVAIGGNIIDYAAQHVFDAEQTMAECFDRPFALDDSALLQQDITSISGVNILYLCDNCGEIVFDSLLVKELQTRGCRLTVAVRDKPIINDATMADAVACGLEKLCPVITNGTACPGTPLDQCSDQFKQHFFSADIIISKGMGNFETLSAIAAPIYFLFTVKCSEVARHVTAIKQLPAQAITGTGEMVLMRQHVEPLC